MDAQLGHAETGLEALREVVAHTFGIDRLRPLQERAIAANLEGRDLLLVLPTGGGKSLCYQAPALVREGLTVVVSPLISLMKDQVDGLVQHGVAAAQLSSAQDSDERRAVFEALERRELKLLYVAPERLMQNGFLAKLEHLGLSALAVDEAHCISHWGHDFRPEYRQLGELKRRLPHVPVHAFTATATERVRQDVVEELGLDDPAVLIGPCDRPNLTYRCLPRRDAVRQVLEVLERHPREAGIVYCISRKEVERVAAELARRGVRCEPYHAGLASHERKRAQERFLSEEIDVVCATVAFGMGIDRTDVRFVIHAGLPKGMEQYGQETGRAGRDGLASECVLLYSGGDFHSWKGLLEKAFREADEEGRPADRDVHDASLERLGRMMGYTTRFVCRHRQLVEYFGQEYEPPEEDGCGACDVCLGEIARTPDATIVAQKILSAVVRCQQRYGAAHVTSVLRGAETAAIRQAGHDRLSTYGLLREHSVAEIRAWIEQLLGQELLLVSGDRYPVLVLSQAGVEVLKGERDVTLFAVPKAPARKRSGGPPLEDGGPPPDEALFERLRDLRRRIARERGIPPYLVFNDRTLAQLASRKPRTPEEFLAIKGVGDKKAADLGPLFLAEIAGEGSAAGVSEAP